MNIEMANDVITHPLFGVLCSFTGFYFGSRLAYWRDWRNDFNELADVMFSVLSQERRDPSAYRAGLLDADFAFFRRRLRWYSVRGFDSALRKYREGRRQAASAQSFCIAA
jgi:hypothetical protein